MKVIVGMSGGVDSTVAAYILRKQGFNVIGAYFDFLKKNKGDGDNYCNKRDSADLDSIAEKLGIEIIKRDYSTEFKNKIIDRFVNDYKNGITPNPCTICNGTMKFKKLLEVMKETGASYIATGHYANVIKVEGDKNLMEPLINVQNANNTINNLRYCIRKSKNLQKDQSYMLYTLTQDELSHIIFPIGNMVKDEVRNAAKSLGLDVADKKDSQDVCFINNYMGENYDYKEFIKCYDFGFDYKEKIARGKLLEKEILDKPYLKPGEFVDIDGNVLGYHKGIINYTIGQRKGLNIAFGERKFVRKIDVEKNQVVLCDNNDLFSDEFYIKNIVYQKTKPYISNVINSDSAFTSPFIVKVRYRHEGTECMIKEEKNCNILKVKLKEKVRAITPGQAAVFYDNNGDICFGGEIT